MSKVKKYFTDSTFSLCWKLLGLLNVLKCTKCISANKSTFAKKYSF